VIDAFDIMIHLLNPANRERYALENLWKDAVEISLDEALGKVEPRPAKKKPTAKSGAKAKAPAKKAAPKKVPAKKGAPKKPTAKARKPKK